MTDPTNYHAITDPATGSVGAWLYSGGGDHKSTVSFNQDYVLDRTVTAGTDIDIYPHYALTPKKVNNNGDPTQGYVAGNITVSPTHYKASADYTLYFKDLSTGAETNRVGDSISAEDNTADWNNSDKFDYTSKNDITDGYHVAYHMTSGHQYKVTLKLSAHNYTDIHDNSNMWCKVNQRMVLDGLRYLGF